MAGWESPYRVAPPRPGPKHTSDPRCDDSLVSDAQDIDETPVLPAIIGSVSLSARPQWEQVLTNLLSRPSGPGARHRRESAHLVYERLRGTPHQAAIHRVLDRWFRSDDSFRVGAAIGFAAAFPDSFARPLIGLMPRLNDLRFEDPHRCDGRTLRDSVVDALVAIETERAPPEFLRDLIRERALRPGGIESVRAALLKHDPDWLGRQLGAISRTTPSAAVGLLHALHERQPDGWNPGAAAASIVTIRGIERALLKRFAWRHLKGKERSLIMRSRRPE
jgi:hypothetical protein